MCNADFWFEKLLKPEILEATLFCDLSIDMLNNFNQYQFKT